jgi:hypothetical protein
VFDGVVELLAKDTIGAVAVELSMFINVLPTILFTPVFATVISLLTDVMLIPAPFINLTNVTLLKLSVRLISILGALATDVNVYV